MYLGSVCCSLSELFVFFLQLVSLNSVQVLKGQIRFSFKYFCEDSSETALNVKETWVIAVWCLSEGCGLYDNLNSFHLNTDR